MTHQKDLTRFWWLNFHQPMNEKYMQVKLDQKPQGEKKQYLSWTCSTQQNEDGFSLQIHFPDN